VRIFLSNEKSFYTNVKMKRTNSGEERVETSKKHCSKDNVNSEKKVTKLVKTASNFEIEFLFKSNVPCSVPKGKYRFVHFGKTPSLSKGDKYWYSYCDDRKLRFFYNARCEPNRFRTFSYGEFNLCRKCLCMFMEETGNIHTYKKRIDRLMELSEDYRKDSKDISIIENKYKRVHKKLNDIQVELLNERKKSRELQVQNMMLMREIDYLTQPQKPINDNPAEILLQALDNLIRQSQPTPQHQALDFIGNVVNGMIKK
jgi:hypothetical protein